MLHRTRGLLFVFLFSWLTALLPIIPLQATPSISSDVGIAPPPLPRSCIQGGTPIDDYDRAACCVSGYIYLNGAPVTGAEVTVSTPTHSVTVHTVAPAPGEPASFSVSLSDDPLLAQPGDTITITASAGGQTRTKSVTVLSGGQQIDIALPQSAVAATWEVGEHVLSSRHSSAVASDSNRNRVVLFGGFSDGADGTGVLGDTWEWNGTTWVLQRVPSAPPARWNAAMAYDEARGRVVLFGGRGETANLADTWEWDGTTWQERIVEQAPPPRNSHTLAYDPISKRTFLFGGDGSTNRFLTDTWVWDGTTWTQLNPINQLPESSDANLAYYAPRGRLTLQLTPRGAPYGSMTQTWEWDGSTWIQRFPANAPPVGNYQLTYDVKNQILLLVGIRSSISNPWYQDVWSWDGTDWVEIHSALHARWYTNVAYDLHSEQVLLICGSLPDVFKNYSLYYYGKTNETWAFDGYSWSQVAPRDEPNNFYRYGLVYDAARRRTIAFIGGQMWSWDGNTWSQLRPPRMPDSRNMHAMAYDVTRKVIVLFGGSVNQNYYANDTWEWDGTTWTQRTPTTSPSPRANAAMVYDEQRQVMVLFGGVEKNKFFNDTWEWDGTTWTQRFPMTSPTAMQSTHSMAYDAARGETVLFGELGMWIYDGVTWTQHVTSPMPSRRQYTSLAYDTVRQRIILFGGLKASITGENDLWEWDGTSWTRIYPEVNPLRRYEHEMAFDTVRGRTVLFGGFVDTQIGTYNTNDTWEWDGSNWFRNSNDDDDRPGASINTALSYADNGNSILFGGRSGNTLNPNTYEWQGNQWRQRTPRHSPAPREGMRLARNNDGSRLLLFGGRAADGSYTSDTWAWQSDDWVALTPPTTPTARGFYGLTFDTRRGVWVLFGGQDATRYFNDTWEFDDTTWVQRQVTTSPPPRSNATLTYDERRGVSVLISGQNTDGLLDDVWEWDGTTWRNVTPIERLGQRTGHGAAYDSVNGVVVVAGGVNPAGAALDDTWEWNGQSWTQRVVVQPMAARAFFGMTYDGQRGEMIAFGGQNGTTWIQNTHLHRVLGAIANPLPIATIVQATPRDARRGIDTITLVGMGADADATDEITAYRWTHHGVVIGEEATLTLDPEALPLGVQNIGFAVRDNEGAWSQQVLQPLIIRTEDGRTTHEASWTLLIYAVADNDLHLWMGDNAATNGMLYRLSRAGAQQNVQVGVLYDGPESGDTWLYTLDEAGFWSRARWQGGTEARMDDQATLTAFLRWGQVAFRTDHYALALVDHANGVVGIGQDKTSDGEGRAFLTPTELRGAIQEVTDDGARRLDVVMFDGCSFGLLENAAIVDGLAHFVVASPNTGWGVFPYERYRQIAGAAPDPKSLAVGIAQTYATRVATAQLPYTISVLDLAALNQLRISVGELGDSLLTYIAGNRATRIAQIRNIRTLTQKYDSGGLRLFAIDDEDSYLDLTDLARQLKLGIDDPGIDAAATAVERDAQAMVVFADSTSGRFMNRSNQTSITVELRRANGLAIYYPPRTTSDTKSAYVGYIGNERFEITRDWGWSRFLAGGLPALSAGDPAPMTSDSIIPPLLTTEVEPRAGNSRIVLTETSGGTVSSPDGTAQASFLSGSATDDITVEFLDDAPLPAPLPDHTTLIRSIRIDAHTASGQRIIQSVQPFRLTIAQPPTQHESAGLESSTPTRSLVAWTGEQWVTVLPCTWCTVDPATGTVSILDNRFTTFALVDVAPPTLWKVYLPSVYKN